jgi:hypothetical protein
VQTSRIPQALGISNTDPRLYGYINEAQERLLPKGKWWGTYARMRLCASDGCITMPPQVATVEAAAVCGCPVAIRSMMFEFLENGAGIRDGKWLGGTSFPDHNCWPEVIYRGNYPVFTDIIGTGNKLLFICDVAEDVGNQVLLLGIDDDGNIIRTKQNGVWSDGELVTLAQSPGTLTVNNFSRLDGVQFLDDSNGQSWLYSVNGSNQVMLGHYQHFERNPSYPRYLFPSIKPRSSGYIPVDIIAKLDFIPVRNPNDYLIIGCIPALKEECQFIKKKENAVSAADVQEALAFEGQAVQLLDAELDHHLGTGWRTGITVSGSSVGGNQPIPLLI